MNKRAFPGVTTKLLSKYVDKILLAVPEAKKYLGDCDDRCVVTGNPIRGSVLKADRDISRIELGIPDDKVCILSFGGSLGARRINEAIADLMAWHYKRGKIWHIHATGSYGVELIPSSAQGKGVDVSGCRNISIREYIDDMPRCLAAAGSGHFQSRRYYLIGNRSGGPGSDSHPFSQCGGKSSVS